MSVLHAAGVFLIFCPMTFSKFVYMYMYVVNNHCHHTVGAKLKFTFRFRTTVVLRYEMSRSVSTDSSVLT